MYIRDLEIPDDPWALARRLGAPPGSALLDRAAPFGAEPWTSALAFDPLVTLEARGDRVSTRVGAGGPETVRGDPFEVLGDWLRRTRLAPRARRAPFEAGWIGAFGYGLAPFAERGVRVSPGPAAMPDLHLSLYDPIFLYDHASGAWRVLAHGYSVPDGRFDRRLAKARADRALMRLLGGAPRAEAPAAAPERAAARSNLDWPAYRERIARLRAYLEAGDLYQANLAQCFEARADRSALDLYGRMRARNPAPFGALLAGEGWELLVNSPERFLRREGDRIETRPIKGTRPRGKDAEEDGAQVEALLADEKEAAEHVMIVDLERNDLGRVCAYGSVRPRALREVQTLPTLHHLVSTIEGRLRPGVELPDILRATFPGGSITGAPKRRAMEIIEELEPEGRGPYTGAVGWIDLSGDFDLAIAIRVALRAEGRVRYWAGGGIVYDSDAAREYEESRLKARAFLEALGDA